MKNFIGWLKIVGMVLGLLFMIVFVAWCDHYKWRAQHPNAPGWSYMFSCGDSGGSSKKAKR